MEDTQHQPRASTHVHRCACVHACPRARTHTHMNAHLMRVHRPYSFGKNLSHLSVGSKCDTRKLPVRLQGPGLMSHTPALLTVETHLDPCRPDLLSLTDLRVSVEINKRKRTQVLRHRCVPAQLSPSGPSTPSYHLGE